VQDVTVIGAGVIGLSTAICLAEAGLTVAVHAAQPPERTTSVAAGAIWGPHLVGADDRIGRWAGATRRGLSELMDYPFVRECRGMSATGAPGDHDPPEVAHDAPDLALCDAAEVPAGYAVAWRFSASLVSMPEYLDYLRQRYLQAGGRPIVAAAYPALADAVRAADSPVLVNCSGAGARHLVPDPAVRPFRGQVAIVRNPGITEFFVGVAGPDAELTYVLPHANQVVLGGTEQGDEWSLAPDAATAQQIVTACARVIPLLAGAEIVEHRVGLRPFRPSVRLERETGPDGTTIVHNYGHGGSGVTLSWGCAQDAAALAIAALDGHA
jgi:D-amino-acid oxidase